ncbi:hypothetical protein CRG98_018606 [Punica granatum]|uniref:Uncharacterized protein n=1 Tax=Punica granatum TaxID=22663 RepID=A0A2I0JZT4_PUNGR|nr:hypothetical protein CRG98_018606 [Punica granatum]
MTTNSHNLKGNYNMNPRTASNYIDKASKTQTTNDFINGKCRRWLYQCPTRGRALQVRQRRQWWWGASDCTWFAYAVAAKENTEVGISIRDTEAGRVAIDIEGRGEMIVESVGETIIVGRAQPEWNAPPAGYFAVARVLELGFDGSKQER